VSENEVSELKRIIECVQIDCNIELERRRAAEREVKELKRLFDYERLDFDREAFDRTSRAVAKEREACARAIETCDVIPVSPVRDRDAIASAIRRRGIDHGLDAAKGPDLELLTRPELYALIERLRK
jgi:hypothetical protein